MLTTKSELMAKVAQIVANVAREDAELKAARAAVAKRNLARAKRMNEIGLCQTEIGFATLTHVDGVYTLTKGCLDGPIILAIGKPRDVAPTLGSIFKVD